MTIEKVKDIPVAQINTALARQTAMDQEVIVRGTSDGGYWLIMGRKITLFDLCAVSAADYRKQPCLTLRRYDANDKQLWEKSYQNFNGYVYQATALADGSLAITTDTDFDDSQPAKYIIGPTSNAWFSKISLDGSVAWSKKISKNYEYMDQLLEAANGDLYTWGTFNRVDIPDYIWDHDTTDARTNVGICQYNKNGKLLNHMVADVGFNGGMYQQNYATVYLRPGKGVLVAYGACLELLGNDLSKKWVYPFPDTDAIVDPDHPSVPTNFIPTDHTAAISSDSITVTQMRVDGKFQRTTVVNWSGKLVKQTESVPAADTVYSLQNGKSVYIRYPASGRNKVELRFAQSSSMFDSFTSVLAAKAVNPISDGGFVIVYSGEISENSDYVVVTRYNPSGQTVFQRVLPLPKRQYNYESPYDPPIAVSKTGMIYYWTPTSITR